MYGFGFITECNEELIYYASKEDMLKKDNKINGIILMDSQLQAFLMGYLSTKNEWVKTKKLSSNLCGFSFGITHRCPVL